MMVMITGMSLWSAILLLYGIFHYLTSKSFKLPMHHLFFNFDDRGTFSHMNYPDLPYKYVPTYKLTGPSFWLHQIRSCASSIIGNANLSNSNCCVIYQNVSILHILFHVLKIIVGDYSVTMMLTIHLLCLIISTGYTMLSWCIYINPKFVLFVLSSKYSSFVNDSICQCFTTLIFITSEGYLTYLSTFICFVILTYESRGVMSFGSEHLHLMKMQMIEFLNKIVIESICEENNNRAG